ncbi:MAG: hypothetical protein KF767_14970 [Bdellovibrionaceae bacterium]|nr:hypothetical protein [Pseudobdellovibrionaceae bacterium]
MKPSRAFSTFWFLGLGLLLALNTGCTPKTEIATPVVPAKSAKKVVVKTLRQAEMKPEDKQLKDWAIELKKSHEIFREVWAHLWEDRLQNPMSVFFEVERLLQTHKNPETGHFQARRTECPAKASEVEFLRDAAGAIQGGVFYRLPCRGTELLSGRTEIARVHKNGRRQMWSFVNEAMPRAAGQSMAFLRETTRCVSSLDERSRMTALECQNLGQNRDLEMHINFSQFRYQKNAATLVEVEGKKFKLLTTPVCDSPKFCTTLKVPLAGTIQVFDDTVSEQVRQERLQAMRKKERDEEAKEALEQHKKNIAELQKNPPKMAPAPGSPTPSMPSGVIPGQTLGHGQLPPGVEPQFGGDAFIGNDQAGPPSFSPRPVGADGIAVDPVMEFEHGEATPGVATPGPQILSEEEYNARLGQPDGGAPVELPREAHHQPIER